MNKRNKILIIGGYGAVGRHIARFLSGRQEAQVVIAGRSLQKAKQLAKGISGTTARQVDVQTLDTAALHDAKLVIMCVENVDAAFAQYCVDHGVHYIDITANTQLLSRIELLDTHHAQGSSLLLLSVGLAPGISNLLAKHALNRHLQSDWANIDILLGLGEKHGHAAFEWTFDNIHSTYTLSNGYGEERVRSFTQPKRGLSAPRRRYFLFNFSDQHSLAKQWPEKSIKTRMAFDTSFLTELLYLGRRLGLTRALRSKALQHFLFKLFNRISVGTDVFSVEVSCGNEQEVHYATSFAGLSEGLVTAAVTAEAALLALGSAKRGILHIHHLVDDVPAFLHRVAAYDDSFKIRI